MWSMATRNGEVLARRDDTEVDGGRSSSRPLPGRLPDALLDREHDAAMGLAAVQTGTDRGRSGVRLA